MGHGYSRLAAPSCWLAVPVLHRHHSMWPILCKYDENLTPEVRNIIATSTDEVRVADVDRMRKIGEDGTCIVTEICSRTDRQTDTVITILRLPYRSRSNNLSETGISITFNSERLDRCSAYRLQSNVERDRKVTDYSNSSCCSSIVVTRVDVAAAAADRFE